MLKLSDLALRPDLQLGSLLVSPARRLVEGPGGHNHLEPLIMQVFLLLLDARGKVVTRTELFEQCWGGVMVGDDSLNRAIAKVRRVGAHVAPGLYEIETIPRTGYRLTGEILNCFDEAGATGKVSTQTSHVSRRMLIGAGAATAAAAGGLALLSPPSREKRQFDAVMARGEEAFRNGTAFEQANLRENHNPDMMALYREAVSLQPESAKAWGLLAYFRVMSADRPQAKDSSRLLLDAQAAIDRALQLDSTEPNARVAKFRIEGRMMDWTARDNFVRDILRTEPRNLLAMMELMPILQATGLTRESWTWNERILQASPLARSFLVFRSMKLWILGRIRESDNVIDRVRGLWPEFGFGRWIRFILFALTDRPSAALAMLDATPTVAGGPDKQEMWRTSLLALDSRARPHIVRARDALLKRANRAPESVNDIVMLLGALGQIDDAFEVTESFVLWRGRFVSSDQADGRKMDDYSRRMTQWLFTPTLAAMRADPRFAKLCDEFGLTAYWRARNVRPDYIRYP